MTAGGLREPGHHGRQPATRTVARISYGLRRFRELPVCQSRCLNGGVHPRNLRAVVLTELTSNAVITLAYFSRGH
jgi:hypothetical protein